MSQYKLLSTKKIPGSLKEEAKQKGIDVLEQEFIEIRSLYTKEKHEEVLPWITNPDPIAVVFTSKNGVTNAFKHLQSYGTWYIPNQWQIFCLEGATKDAVDEQTFGDQIVDTATDATSLAQKIIATGNVKKVVFFCGNKRRDELPNLLKENGIEVNEVVVYETVETPVVTTQDLDAVLFFSPSGVKSFFSVNSLAKKTACFAIGSTTAEAITDYTDNRVITSEHPTTEMLMASAWFYFQNINCYE